MHLNTLPSGYTLHWYRIERVLGQGGFGITYLAQDTNLDQVVAIKEYLPTDIAVRAMDKSVQPNASEQKDRYRWGLERFIEEARTLARFDHPNIVRVLSVFELNNTAYMVMRYERGDSLDDILDHRKSLEEKELSNILFPILDGLEKVHEAGFIHRDIQPANIFLRKDGSPVLLDFGSARQSGEGTRTLTILIAPGYAPFEQYYSNSEQQGPWTDIYSLGATLYRAVARVAPIDAIARSRGILGSTRDILVPAVEVGKGRYSESFLKAIDHALMFNEGDRPQSIADWRRDFSTKGEGAATKPDRGTPAGSPNHDVKTDVASKLARSVEGATGPNWLAARSIWFVAGALVVLTAFLFGGWFYLKKQPSSPEVAIAQREGQEAPSRPAERAVREEHERVAGVVDIEEEKRRAAEEAKRKAEEEARRAAAEEAKRKAEEEARRVAAEEAKRKAEEEARRVAAEEAARIAEEHDRARARQKRLEEDRMRLEAEQKKREAEQFTSGLAAYEKGNYPEAFDRLLPLAEKGVMEAVAKVGVMYLYGFGTTANETKALRLLKLAADTNLADAQYYLGVMHALGKGVSRDNTKAVAFYRKAAEQGYGPAQNSLGLMYANGRGVEKDETEAVSWYRKAAEQGNIDAQTNLGHMYAAGRGVPQNNFQAYAWFNLAVISGDEVARYNRDLLASKLQPVELRQAEKLTREYRAKYNNKQ